MKIEIYGTEVCQYCSSSKDLAKTLSEELDGISYSYYDLMEGDNLSVLENRVGGKVHTIPRIFIDGELIGGHTEFVAFVNAAENKAGGLL